jgi:hypothetical protein
MEKIDTFYIKSNLNEAQFYVASIQLKLVNRKDLQNELKKLDKISELLKKVEQEIDNIKING